MTRPTCRGQLTGSDTPDAVVTRLIHSGAISALEPLSLAGDIGIAGLCCERCRPHWKQAPVDPSGLTMDTPAATLVA
jgi:hypothetical protein